MALRTQSRDGRSLALDELEDFALALAREEWGGGAKLWPAPFNEDTFESAWAFVLECWTWNEAEKAEQPFPDKEYLKEYAREWTECRKEGRTLITEKCRRMVISWEARALELHQMGLGKVNCILAGEDLEASAKHVSRLKFLYDGLRKRHPEWGLPEPKTTSYRGDLLASFALPNGSITNYANGQASSLQGDGTAIITLEEFGQYRYAARMLAQSKIITQGSAGSVGGFVNVITNTSPNYEWQQVKAGARRIA